jgi:DNA-damage-inducible protein J
MAKSANLYIRIDPETKTEAERLFANFGITITDAVNMFLYKSIMVGGLPFELIQPKPNATTLAAMSEIEQMKKTKTGGAATPDELFKELGI